MSESHAIYWVVFIIGFLSFAGLAWYHEQVHVAIFKSYGIDSEVEYFPEGRRFDFITRPEKPCPSEGCILAHNITDAIGYHILPIWAGLVVIFPIFIIKLVEILETLKEKNDG